MVMIVTRTITLNQKNHIRTKPSMPANTKPSFSSPHLESPGCPPDGSRYTWFFFCQSHRILWKELCYNLKESVNSPHISRCLFHEKARLPQGAFIRYKGTHSTRTGALHFPCSQQPLSTHRSPATQTYCTYSHAPIPY